MSKAVTPHLRGKTYWYRKRVPTKLVNYFGKEEWCFSLRTKDYSEALERCARKDQEKSAEIGIALKRLRYEEDHPDSPTFHNDFSDEQIDNIVQVWFRDASRKHDAEARDFNRNLNRIALSKRQEKLEQEEQFWLHQIEVNSRQSMGKLGNALESDDGRIFEVGHKDWIEEQVSEILQKRGVELHVDSYAFQKLIELVRRGKAEIARRYLRIISGKPPVRSEDGYFEGVEVDKALPKEILEFSFEPLTFGKLLDKYLAHKKSLALKTKLSYIHIGSLLEDYFGADTVVSTLNQDDFIALRDDLSVLPPNYKKKYPNKRVQLVAREVEEDDEIPVVKGRTINKKFETISAILNYAVDQDLIIKNYARKIRVPEEPWNGKKTFTLDELNVVFNTPLYTGCVDDETNYFKEGNRHPRRSRFWVPLVALFQGMRLNEICQLYVEDLKEENGIPYIAVRKYLDDGNRAFDKQVKTTAGNREVPLHPMLIKCGFRKFVEEKRKSGAKRLFEELELSKTLMTYSDPFQKWFRRFLIKHEVKKEGERYPCFHSFRHTFKDALEREFVDPRMIRMLGGWKGNTGEEGSYGDGFNLSSRYEAISKINYDGLKISHLWVDKV